MILTIIYFLKFNSFLYDYINGHHFTTTSKPDVLVAIHTQSHQHCWSVCIIHKHTDHTHQFVTTYRIYANIPRIFFPEFSEEKLGCTHYLKQCWYCSASKQMIPSHVKELSVNHVLNRLLLQDLVITRSRQKKSLG